MIDMRETFETPVKPLNNKRIVITRALSQAAEMTDLLRAHGAEILSYPCLDFAPVEDFTVLDASLRQASNGGFDWLVFTSANAVQFIKSRLDALNLSLKVSHIAAVGPATAEAAHRLLGLSTATIGEEFRAASLAESIDIQPGAKVLFPKADIAPTALARKLEARSAVVTVVTAYRNVMGMGGVDLPLLLLEHQVDVITFASPSAIRNFLWRLVEEGGSTADLTGVVIACIGPETRARAIDCGLQVQVTPSVATLESLIASLEDHYR